MNHYFGVLCIVLFSGLSTAAAKTDHLPDIDILMEKLDQQEEVNGLIRLRAVGNNWLGQTAVVSYQINQGMQSDNSLVRALTGIAGAGVSVGVLHSYAMHFSVYDLEGLRAGEPALVFDAEKQRKSWYGSAIAWASASLGWAALAVDDKPHRLGHLALAASHLFTAGVDHWVATSEWASQNELASPTTLASTKRMFRKASGLSWAAFGAGLGCASMNSWLNRDTPGELSRAQILGGLAVVSSSIGAFMLTTLDSGAVPAELAALHLSVAPTQAGLMAHLTWPWR